MAGAVRFALVSLSRQRRGRIDDRFCRLPPAA